MRRGEMLGKSRIKDTSRIKVVRGEMLGKFRIKDTSLNQSRTWRDAWQVQDQGHKQKQSRHCQ